MCARFCKNVRVCVACVCVYARACACVRVYVRVRVSLRIIHTGRMVGQRMSTSGDMRSSTTAVPVRRAPDRGLPMRVTSVRCVVSFPRICHKQSVEENER